MPRTWMPARTIHTGERVNGEWVEFVYSTFDVWPELLAWIEARRARILGK